jgi:hypothetical protein
MCADVWPDWNDGLLAAKRDGRFSARTPTCAICGLSTPATATHLKIPWSISRWRASCSASATRRLGFGLRCIRAAVRRDPRLGQSGPTSSPLGWGAAPTAKSIPPWVPLPLPPRPLAALRRAGANCARVEERVGTIAQAPSPPRLAASRPPLASREPKGESRAWARAVRTAAGNIRMTPVSGVAAPIGNARQLGAPGHRPASSRRQHGVVRPALLGWPQGGASLLIRLESQVVSKS